MIRYSEFRMVVSWFAVSHSFAGFERFGGLECFRVWGPLEFRVLWPRHFRAFGRV